MWYYFRYARHEGIFGDGGIPQFVAQHGSKWEMVAFTPQPINLLTPDFFLILAHTVYKMWIIQEPNTVELWNKLHFEKEETESM